jgi:phospholipase C
MTPDELKKNVDTIVVVMMENRSFDNVLGHLRHPEGGNRPEVAGIEDFQNDRYINKNTDGLAIRPFWRDDMPFVSDLPHNASGVKEQLAFSPFLKSYLMDGFVRAFEDQFHSIVAEPPVMGLLRAKDLPTTSPLAEQYTVCDNWFACLPTSTAPNRLMSMCGATPLADTGTVLPDQPTVYDWLLDHGIRWRVYAAGLPFFALMPATAPLMLTGHFRRLSALDEDVKTEGAGDWPQVIFIEPDYYDCPVHFHPPCDNHAPLAMAPGEAFLAGVYRSLQSNPAKWARTVFILTYDEHGGLFDHVPPLSVSYRNPNGVSFDTTGPRTPTIVAGPFAPKRGVSKLALDNTSILQLIAERFGAIDEAYSHEVLGRAQQGIKSVSAVLDAAAGNTGICPLGTGASTGDVTTVVGSPLRTSFDSAIRSLVDRHQTEALTKYPELRRYLGRS